MQSAIIVNICTTIFVIVVICVVYYTLNKADKETNESISMLTNSTQSDLMETARKSRENIRSETEEMITTETSPMKQDISTNAKNITLQAENITENKNKIGIISANYDSLNKIVTNLLDTNKAEHAGMSKKISEQGETLSSQIGAINETVNALKKPYIAANEESAMSYIRGNKQSIYPGQIVFTSDENNADYWVDSNYSPHIVQGKIIPKDVFDLIHPVGSILFRFDLTDPAKEFKNKFGVDSEWKKIDGAYMLTTSTESSHSDKKTPTYVNSDVFLDKEPNNATMAKKGIFTSLLHVLTLNEIPSHNHVVSGNTKDEGNHKHNLKGGTDGGGIHSHVVSNLKVTGSTDTKGNHNHGVGPARICGDEDGSNRWTWSNKNTNAYNNMWTTWSGDHSHSISGKASGNTDSVGAHSHDFSKSALADFAGIHKHSFEVTSKNSGNGVGHSHGVKLPQVYVVMWVRTK